MSICSTYLCSGRNGDTTDYLFHRNVGFKTLDCTVAQKGQNGTTKLKTRTNYKTLLQIAKRFHKLQNAFTSYKTLLQIPKRYHKFKNEFTNGKTK